MSTRLVILGLLRQKPLYGYELKRILEEEMGDWTNIEFGSIYFALNKLAEEGFVQKLGEEKQGRRPSRSVYQITAQGRDEFLRLLRAVWKNPERHYYTEDVALAFSDALPREEVIGYLKERVARMEGVLKHLDEHQAEQLGNPDVPPLAEAVFEHSRLHFRAELEWTQIVLRRFERGEF